MYLGHHKLEIADTTMVMTMSMSSPSGLLYDSLPGSTAEMTRCMLCVLCRAAADGQYGLFRNDFCAHTSLAN